MYRANVVRSLLLLLLSQVMRHPALIKFIIQSSKLSLAAAAAAATVGRFQQTGMNLICLWYCLEPIDRVVVKWKF